MPDTWNFSRRSRQADISAQPPILTLLLIGLSVLITVASLTAGDETGSLWYNIGHFGEVSSERIWNGRYWGLVTCIFVHGSWIHLLFNMIWLYQIGLVLEATLNQGVYFLIVLAAAIVGSTCEMLISGSTGIGMSGVVYALFGLMWAGRTMIPAWASVATPQNLQIMVGWGLFCIVATKLHFLQIANGAHGGGFLLGLCLGFLFFSIRPHRLWAIPLALLVGVSVLAVTWMPWSPDWTFWKAGKEFDKQHYTQAIRWYHTSLAEGGEAQTIWHNIGAAWLHIADQEQTRGNTQGVDRALAGAKEAEQKSGPSGDDQ
jgi:rhomboid protease GluP